MLNLITSCTMSESATETSCGNVNEYGIKFKAGDDIEDDDEDDGDDE